MKKTPRKSVLINKSPPRSPKLRPVLKIKIKERKKFSKSKPKLEKRPSRRSIKPSARSPGS